ncbi:hypothetical protein [Kurthia zopfii]|uniref:hypothetical protein n=1 Tax=Kurthia zopfii TaxID=1650 RepID=UPI000F6B7E73|nr:hypothetical protein [Kurthia zopfii]VEI06172.1 Uncharacterised protein [Kurthia zopfii]
MPRGFVTICLISSFILNIIFNNKWTSILMLLALALWGVHLFSQLKKQNGV